MIETARLKLDPLSHSQLQDLLIQPDQLENEIKIRLSGDITESRVENAIRVKLEKMDKASEDRHIWLTYWLLVIKSNNIGVGLLGFKGPPDEYGIVEIGYGIAPAHRSRGYITEAVKSLIDWAFKTPACQSIIAPETLKTNLASNRVLEKVGMQVYEQTREAISWKLDRLMYNQRSNE